MSLDIYWNTGSSQMTSGGAVHVRLACNCGREVWGRPSITIAGASIISCASRGEPAYHSTTTPPACITPPPTSTTLLTNQVKIKQRLPLDSRVCHSTSIHSTYPPPACVTRPTTSLNSPFLAPSGRLQMSTRRFWHNTFEQFWPGYIQALRSKLG